ncbi:hypothetical protein ABTX83_14685 [Streptomyces werraensis]|uniref:hypothetical protein n=1 Tax=Streptomyces werraensis TaxID=68284 RepID=UPI00332680BB
MTQTQDQVPEPQEVVTNRETTAIDGRIPAALLHELAEELAQTEGQMTPETTTDASEAP